MERWMCVLVTACAVPGAGPRIDRVDPDNGPSTESVAVDIQGSFQLAITSDLDTGDTVIDGNVAATIDGVALADTMRSDDGLITATVPQGLAVGRHDVTVTIGSERMPSKRA